MSFANESSFLISSNKNKFNINNQEVIGDISLFCSACKDPINSISNSSDEQIVNANGETYHSSCFVCAQCFEPFQDGVFYEFDNRKYCETDFKLQFAPICDSCNDYISGRVVKAMGKEWHPECFCCNSCGILLLESGFIKNVLNDKPYCKECNLKDKLKNNSNPICQKCATIIDDDLIRFKGETYHAFHFLCHLCATELTHLTAREVREHLYCLKCYDKLDVPVCGACHTTIDQERIVYALGKQWHVEHFACNKCEIPFNGTRHYEKRGLAYCETHFNQLFGNLCFVCNRTISGDVFSALNKSWCVEHFTCYLCDDLMNKKTKFYDLDSKPVCKHCFDKLPSKIKSSILKSYDSKEKEHNSLFSFAKRDK